MWKKTLNITLPFAVFASEAYCGWMLWNWFFVPVSLAHFIGLLFLFGLIAFYLGKHTTGNISLLKLSLVDAFKTTDDQATLNLYVNIIHLFVPWIYLGFGYLALLFI